VGYNCGQVRVEFYLHNILPIPSLCASDLNYISGFLDQVVVLKQQDEQTYQLYTEFKSHESEFDFLTSMEIEEKINVIQWFPFVNYGGSRLLLTANGKLLRLFFPLNLLIVTVNFINLHFCGQDKTIKLFKMFEKTKFGPEKSGKKTEVVVKPQKVTIHKTKIKNQK
jgi:hypothetical protein